MKEIITEIIERQIEKDQQYDEKDIYEKTEVGKLDTSRGVYHIYQFYKEPIECFIGKKVTNIIKRLGNIGTTEIVKEEFEKLKQFENELKIYKINTKNQNIKR